LPVPDGRPSTSRLRPAEDGERTNQRNAFGKLLDRFAQPDAAKDPLKQPAERHSAENCDAPQERPAQSDGAAAGDRGTDEPTSTTTDSTDASSESPATLCATVMPVEPTFTAPLPELTWADPALPFAPVAPIDAVAVAAIPALPPVLQDPMPQTAAAAEDVAAIAGFKPIALQASVEPVAEAPAQTVAAVFSLETAETAPIQQVFKIAKKMEGSPAANAAALPQESTLEDLGDLGLRKMPAVRIDPNGGAAEVDDPLRQLGLAKAEPAPAAGETAAPAAVRSELKAMTDGGTPVLGALAAADAPRNAAAVYNKVADAIKSAEAIAPADQISIRLLHAVAEGKKAIQVHLHPAELGAIDVRMQWQGDRLSAQFVVDRPETLQLLQRDVPALERTLSQAGINLEGGGLSFSLRQQQGNGQNGQPLYSGATNSGDSGEMPVGDEPLGDIIRDGLLSIRV
jgi:flagellar hook-length control protein FliK